MGHDRFDDLTRALATGISRRQTLKLLGRSLVGAALAALLPGGSEAAPGTHHGNAVCADFCTKTFPPGRKRGECIGRAAHGRGPCYECGGPRAAPCSAVCLTSTEGKRVCVNTSVSCACPPGNPESFPATCPACTASNQCGSNSVCVVGTACSGGICLLLE